MHKKRCWLILVTVMVGLCVAATRSPAENWPQWRGPGRDGISGETGIATTWSKTESVLWRTPLPGPGGATPIVWDDRIFVTSVDGNDLVLLCYNTSGKQLWRQRVASGNKDVRGDEGNSAAPTPSTDGRHVWTFMANGVLACYTIDGKESWKLDVQDRYGKLKIAFGMTSTPILDGGRLFLQLIHGEGMPDTREARVVCLDAATGDEIWQSGRVTGARSENEHSYASPVLYRDNEREYLVTHGGDYVMAHGLKDGGEIWRRFMNYKAKYHPTLRFVASPLAVPGMIVVPTAKGGPVEALRPEIKGDVSGVESAVLWSRPRGTPDVPSPLVHGELVYLCRENGNLVCLDRKTGRQHYEERTTADRHRASPVYADGKIYTTARNGVISVIKAGAEFELLSQNKMQEATSASPAISGGRIYLRTFEALYAIGEK